MDQQQFQPTTEHTLALGVTDCPNAASTTLGGQLAQLFSDFYVDLDRVRDERGFDPVKALRHAHRPSELLRVFEHLGDRHSMLSLPATAPTTRPPAFKRGLQTGVLRLGLQLESSNEGGSWRTWVKQCNPHIAQLMRCGAEVTHWNGVPIEAAARQLGQRLRGGSRAAQRRLGFRSLTERLVGGAQVPDEDWVWLTVVHEGVRQHIALEWNADFDVHQRTRARCAWQQPLENTLSGDGFRCGVLNSTPSETAMAAMYVRLFSLPHWQDLKALREWLVRFADRPKPPGLILDLRSNPGGEVDTAVELTRLFGVRGPNGNTTDDLVRYSAAKSAAPARRPTPALRSRPAAALTEPRTIRRPERLDLSQVVILVDALTFSAAEILAALLQHHLHATVIGIDPCTGGGPVNTWCFDALARNSDHDVQPLPPGVDLQLPVRRIEIATRCGWQAISEVRIDQIVPTTRDDLFCGNRDLLSEAAQLLLSSGAVPEAQGEPQKTDAEVADDHASRKEST